VHGSLKVIATALPEVLIVEPKFIGDERGFFQETYQADKYRVGGIPDHFVQDNLSYSRRGVLRGLHFQNPDPQAKLVYVLRGEIFDVAVDIRPDSPTFGQWFGTSLSDGNHLQLYIPVGFAHGFVVTSEEALVAYKVTSFYNPAGDASIKWDDPAIGIEWPISEPFLATKDANAPLLADVRREKLAFEGV
jgi:dTDP-4-dehydrorhamnose 3,5-epimerase